MPVVVCSGPCQKGPKGPIDGDGSTASMDGRAIVSGRARGQQTATCDVGMKRANACAGPVQTVTQVRGRAFSQVRALQRINGDHHRSSRASELAASPPKQTWDLKMISSENIYPEYANTFSEEALN
jgi:hypothetical protein